MSWLLLLGCADWEVPEVAPLETEVERVIVVGAGVSGLAAAKALDNAGVEVVVLEARDRVGGRLHTVELEGATLDLGGAWVHGIHGSVSADLLSALEVGLPRDATTGSPSLLDEGGSELSAWSVQRHYNRFWASGARGPSLAEAVESWIEDEGLEGDEARVASWTARIFSELDTAGPAESISLDGIDTWEELGGGDRVPEGGYAPLIEALSADLDLRLSEPVEAIAWNEQGVTVTTDQGEHRGSQVLVTVPLGVLQAGSIAFEPGLGEAKQGALERLDMANLEKVVLVYEERFWEGALLHVDEAGVGAFPTCVDFSEHAGAPALVCLTGGNFSRQVQGELSDEELVAGFRARIAEHWGQDPEPLATSVTHWTTDPWALGSYSYLAVGSSPADLETLAEPLDGRVLFAGEHTIPGQYQSVHGALLSGLREARRLGVQDFGIPGTEGH